MLEEELKKEGIPFFEVFEAFFGKGKKVKGKDKKIRKKIIIVTLIIALIFVLSFCFFVFWFQWRPAKVRTVAKIY